MQTWLKCSIIGSVALLAACGDDDSSSFVPEENKEDSNVFVDEDGVEHTISGCFMERIDDGYRVICGEDSVGVFLNEDNGVDANCTMSPVENGYKVICNKDSVAVLVQDENGLIGEKGEPGTSCTVATLNKGYQIICGEDSLEVVNDNIKDKADISLRVIDYNTGLPITSALVLAAGTNDSLYTDTLGVLTIKDNVLGSYTYIVSKKGYASQVQHIDLAENGQGDVARVRDEFTDVKLRATGATVNGTVLYTDGLTGAVSGASKVKVTLKFSDENLYPSEISTTTDSLGVYSFTNLPESVGYTVFVPQTSIGGSTYASNSNLTVSGLRAGERKDLQVIRLGIVGLIPELVKDNLSGIEAKDTVVFQFSTELIADSIAKSWKVFKGDCDYGTSVLTNATLDKSSTKLSIAPVKGTWTNFDSYCIVGTGFTNDGQRVTVRKTFIPGNINKDLSSITKLAASSYYDNYIQLKWKPTGDRITGYKVYFKTNKENDFRELTSWESGTLPIDSSICNNVTSASACDQYRDIGYNYNTRINYYWYTNYTKRSSTNSDDYYNGYDDSTSTTNVWYVQDTRRVSSDEYYDFTASSTEGKSKFSRTVYIWRIGDEAPYTYDSCEVGNGQYQYYDDCPEYDTYGYYYDYATNFYIQTPIDSSFCSTAGTNSYAYETQCEQYTTFNRAPNARRTVYWEKVPTDSVSCSVANGNDMRYTPKCDSLIRAFAVNEGYLTAYINNNSYYYDDYGNSYYIYNSGRYNSNRYDYSYVWYTKYANKRPLETDSLAFIRNTQIFTTDEVTTASFIVLPYISLNGETYTSNVAEADSVTVKH